jgi:ribosomal protein S18 acetylase RimI-like enzyme
MRDTTRDLSPAELPLAIDANKIAFGELLAALPGAALHDDPGLRWVETGVQLDLFNGVFQSQVAPEALPTEVARIRDHFQARGLPFQWHVGPSSSLADYARLLPAGGIAHVEDEPGMAADLLALVEDIPHATDLTIRPVATADELAAWVGVWGWRAPAEVVRLVREVYSRLPHGPDASLRFYLGSLDGEPVATAALFLAAGVAAVENVVTLPDARRRGIGAAITLHAVRQARAAGYRYAVLSASPMGIGIYRRLGFRECCALSTYAWQPEQEGGGDA